MSHGIADSVWKRVKAFWWLYRLSRESWAITVSAFQGQWDVEVYPTADIYLEDKGACYLYEALERLIERIDSEEPLVSDTLITDEDGYIQTGTETVYKEVEK